MKILGTDVNQLKTSIDKLIEEKTKQHVIIAAEEESSKDEEALNHAKAYWMLGWSWEEIEGILEDLGFSDKITNSAINKAKKYAEETLIDGPFHTLKEGQFIKLKNGLLAKLARKFSNEIEAIVDKDKVLLDQNHIDFQASKELLEAFSFRQTAKNLLLHAQIPGELMKELEEAEEKEKGFEEVDPKDLIEVGRPTEQFNFKITPTKRKPTQEEIKEEKWEEFPKDITQVKEISSSLEKQVKEVLDVHDEVNRTEKELDKFNDELKSLKNDVNAAKVWRTDAGKALASILATENNLINGKLGQVITRYKDTIIAYQKRLISEKLYPTDKEQLEFMKALVKEKVPKAFDAINESLENWREFHSEIAEKVVELLRMYQFKEDKTKKTQSIHTAGVWEKLTSWLSSMWDKIKKSFNKVEDEAIPTLEEAITFFENALATEKKSAKQAAIFNAVKNIK